MDNKVWFVVAKRLAGSGSIFACTAIALGLFGLPVAASATIIDFSVLPSGQNIRSDFFLTQGITFDDAYFVGFVQGQSALIGLGGSAISAMFSDPISAISVTVAQSFAVNADYTLTVFDQTLSPIVSNTLATSASGYSTIELSGFTSAAWSFSIANHADHSPIGLDEFALGSIDFTEAPEPPGFLLGMIGVAAFAGLRRCSWNGRY